MRPLVIALLLATQAAHAAPWKSVVAQGYRLREARFDADGGLTYAPLDAKTKRPGKPQRVMLPEKLAAAIRKALDAARLDELPPPDPEPPLNLAKLSEPFTVTLVFADRSVRYSLNAMGFANERDPGSVRSRLLPVAFAMRDAVDWLDTPPVETAVGRFEVGVQNGRVGVGVDEWSLYRPLADDPQVERLRALAGRRIKMEVARERDRPDVFVLKRVLEKLPP
jgi:hypothetical protein